MSNLTLEEKIAIQSLKKLGEKWPESLLIFAPGGSSLSVRKVRADGGYGISTEVAKAQGFSNDGGDGGDDF